jgi:predicted DNA-binding transcriptional regulator AlpA
MAAEVARMLGLSRQRTYAVTIKPDFPEPIGRLRGGRVWDADDVRAWMEAHRPTDSDEP